MILYDFNIKTDSDVINNIFDYVIAQIELLFDTNKGDVLGDYSFGTDYEQFIWDLELPNSAISAQIEADIKSNVDLAGATFDVSTTLLHGTENDIIMVSINVYFDQYYKNLTYNIG